MPAENCILEGVNKLPAAHCLTWPLTGGATRLRRYWDLPAADAVKGESPMS